MNRATFVTLAIIGEVILGLGCATVQEEGGVATSLVSIRPLEASLFETKAELTLRYTNESARALPLAGSTHKLYINGTYVGRAVTNEQLSLPELGTTTQTLTAHLENLALMGKAREIGSMSTVEYRIDSRIHVADGGGTLRATSTGQVDLSGLLPAEANVSQTK
jgi:hypothetical protein